MSATLESADDGVKRSRVIRQELQLLSEQARRRHSILAHQDALGLSILLVSMAVCVGCSVGYAYHVVPAWAAIVVSAFFLSLLHELEHDLIHRLYFKDSPWLYNTAMLCVWLFRPISINPWVRRDWHLHHHRVSGTAGDLEERGLTNGERWGVRRFFMMIDPLLAIILRPVTIFKMLDAYNTDHKFGRRERLMNFVRNVGAYFPFGPVIAALWWTFLGVHGVQWYGELTGKTIVLPQLLQDSMPLLDLVSVTILAPNMLRIACLYFVSSNIHYHGDVEPKNIIQQTQVWTAPWLYPFQAFCFNFGSTHAIHHFAVQHPFYLRQMIAGDAHRVMREHGVRFNDFASMNRANTWKRVAPLVTLKATHAKVAPVPAVEEAAWSQAANDA